MIDIGMIYDIWYTQKKVFCSFPTWFYNDMIGNYGQMNNQVD